MSLAYSILHEDRVQLITDGAAYTPDGIAMKFTKKVMTSPHVPMAISSIGHMKTGEMIAEELIGLSACGSFDITMMLVDKVVSGLSRLQFPQGADIGMIICGWSETEGPCHFMFATKGDGKHVVPFTLLRIYVPEFCNGIEVTADELAAIGVTPDMPRGPDFVEQHVVDYVNIMRGKKGGDYTRPDAEPIHAIGGHLDLTTVTKDGATTKRIHVWSADRIGERIDPTRTDSPVVPLNRQQRRAAERQTAKAERRATAAA